MKINRRSFLKLSGAAAGTFIMGGLIVDVSPVKAYTRELRIKKGKETTTVCCYCSVGCGILVHTVGGKVINAEGDPDHPINEGSLCSKGSTISQMATNESRLRKPLYRAPGAKAWKEVEWDWALNRIARRVKDTRDRTFKPTTRTSVREKIVAEKPDESGLYRETVADVEKEFAVNRAEGIAHVGSAALDNEECWVYQAMLRALGLVYIEHQARI